MEIPDERTQAHMAISQTPNGKALSWDEKEKVADALITGHTGKLKSPQLREALVESLISLGVDTHFLAEKIKQGLEADETKFFQHEGTVTDARDVIDWGARHNYLRTALKLLGVQDRGAVKINAKNFVYKPLLRGGGEAIEIEAPKEQVLKRRMAAAKHNARQIPEE